MNGKALTGILVSLCTLLAVCSDSSPGDGSGTGKGSGGTAADGSPSGDTSGPQDGAGTTTDTQAMTTDSGPSGGKGAGGTGGTGDGGDTRTCGTRSCDADLEYCRISIPGTGGMTGDSCIPRKGCESCDCIATDVTCTCSKATNGFITLTCRGG